MAAILLKLKPAAGELKLLLSTCILGTVLDEIVAANESATDDFIRISIGPSCELNNTLFMFYDVKIKGNNTLAIEFRDQLPKDTTIKVYSRFGNVTFTLFANDPS